MEDVLTTEYDGCGRCLVAVRRLSRKTDKTSSPRDDGMTESRLVSVAWARVGDERTATLEHDQPSLLG